MNQDEIKEALEHRDVLLHIKAVLVTKSGREFIKYLFKNLDVMEMPELGLEGDILMERLGFLRAGNSIFKLVSQGNSETAASILTDIEREKHDRLYREQRQEREEASDIYGRNERSGES